MNKEQANELLVGYEDLILEFSRKMLWLLRQERGKRYMFAVHNDMHNRTIDKLEKIHKKLLNYAERGW